MGIWRSAINCEYGLVKKKRKLARVKGKKAKLHFSEILMLSEERRREILELLRNDGRVLVRDLAKKFRTSLITIRKDLESFITRDCWNARTAVSCRFQPVHCKTKRSARKNGFINTRS
jgi:hypothetical protein